MRRARLLRAVRRRLSDPRTWIKEYMAVNARGEDCWGDNPGAVAWCVNGAIQAEEPAAFSYYEEPRRYERFRRTVGNEQLRYLDVAVHSMGFANSIQFNNAASTTHADLLGLLDRTIAAYETVR